MASQSVSLKLSSHCSQQEQHCPQEGTPFLPRPSFFVTDFVFVCEQLQAAMAMAGSSRMTIAATTVLFLVLCHQQYGGVQLNVVASASVIDMVTTSDGESTLKPNAKTDANAINRAAFNSTIVYTRLAFLTDTFGPRFSGTSALESALDWIKDEAENGDGFSVKEQTVMVPVWVRGKEYANLISPRHKSMRVLGLGGVFWAPALRCCKLLISSLRYGLKGNELLL